MPNPGNKRGHSTFFDFTYTYDAANRLTTEVVNGTTTTYTHDNTDQLTADGTNTFTYDANGNRNNGSYATGTGNQITNDGTWDYSYDAEGNMTKKSQGEEEETWTYGYDQRNQLRWAEKRATDGGTLQMRADYKYDFKANRIQKAVDSDGDTDIDITERYAYDWWKTGPQTDFVGNENSDTWVDLDGSSSLTTRYLRGDVIDQIFARTDAGSNEAYWLLTDRLGSLRNVVDDTQAVKDSIAYDGFGNIISESDPAFGGHYKWTGRELDVETGLQYNRARYYDGKTGRWISRDPLGFEAGDSNLFRYVNNRPTVETDPSGYATIINYGNSAQEPFGKDLILYSPDALVRGGNGQNETGVLLLYFRHESNKDGPNTSVRWVQFYHFTTKAYFLDACGGGLYATDYLGVRFPSGGRQIDSTTDISNPRYYLDAATDAKSPFYFDPNGVATGEGGIGPVNTATGKGLASYIFDNPSDVNSAHGAVRVQANTKKKNNGDTYIGYETVTYFTAIPLLYDSANDSATLLGFVDWQSYYFHLPDMKYKKDILAMDAKIQKYLNKNMHTVNKPSQLPTNNNLPGMLQAILSPLPVSKP